MAVDDNTTLDRRRSPSEILRGLRENPAVPPKPPGPGVPVPAPANAGAAGEDGPESFDPDSTDYKAFGRAGNKLVPSLRFILKDQSERGFSYAHLDSFHPAGCEFIPSLPGKGSVIRLRFAGASVNVVVTLEGRNLRRCWEMLMGHLTPWVHEYPADIDTMGQADAVVKSITFKAES